MIINVLGATGSLGKKVVNELLIQGGGPANIAVTVRNTEKAQCFNEYEVQVNHGDYDQYDTLVESFKGTDVLLLIPSRAPAEQRITQIFNAVRAAQATGVKRIILSSVVTGGCLDSMFNITPFLLYAESKIRQSGLDWTILRSGRYLDPIADQIAKYVNTGAISLPVNDGKVAFISKDDIARTTATVCLEEGHGGKVYDISGEHAYTLDDIAAAISRITGKEVIFNSISTEQFAENIHNANVNLPKAKVDAIVGTLTSMYRAFDHAEFAGTSKDVEVITGKRADTIEEFLGRK